MDEGVRWVMFLAWCLVVIAMGLLVGWAVADVGPAPALGRMSQGVVR
jgi:hypothetical protein